MSVEAGAQSTVTIALLSIALAASYILLAVSAMSSPRLFKIADRNSALVHSLSSPVLGSTRGPLPEHGTGGGPRGGGGGHSGFLGRPIVLLTKHRSSQAKTKSTIIHLVMPTNLVQ